MRNGPGFLIMLPNILPNLLGQDGQFCMALERPLMSLLRPVDIVAKLRMETLYVKTKHPVHAQLAQFSRVAGSEGGLFFVAQVVFTHHGFEIR
jgi:hypothetical protein